MLTLTTYSTDDLLDLERDAQMLDDCAKRARHLDTKAALAQQAIATRAALRAKSIEILNAQRGSLLMAVA